VETGAKEGDSPVCEKNQTLSLLFSSSMGLVKSCVKVSRLLDKAKYSLRSIVNQYREGKVKSTPGGE